MSEIIFTDVAFRYQESGNFYVLQNLNVRFQSAHITVLTGASGCGKSTLLYLAAGIYPENAGVLSSGSVKIDEDDPSELPPNLRCKRVGMMFQNPALQFCMDTVRNELAFCLENVRTPREEMDPKIDEALHFCCIEHLKDRKLLTLSGGEKQKVMLACLAALSPAWILLDEPFANLDDRSARDIAAKLARLHHEKGTGILAVDHRLENWLGIAEEVKGMDKMGNLIAEGLTRTAHDGRHKKTPHEAQPEPLLQLKNITASYSGTPVLRGLNADFSRGKSYALLGDSGSGKSTLFDVLRGLVPFNGAVFYRGSTVRKKDLGRPGPMGFVTQNPQDQFVADTVYDEILTSLKSKGNRTAAPNAEEDQAEAILRSIGLWGYRRVSPYMLSQGQQRRLGVAAILACACEILICDEPTYAQDWNNTIAIMESLENVMISQGTTLIFSTHDRKLAADFADKIFELKEGILLEYDQSDF
ncbi:ABC transporter ATP-binding protein [Anoxybacterium hadale]|uniref:ABC transporter ATP-binding protein n=1 Tax=Anoxybacterium hadale TaxID=3408580 RepID=A0ACD1ABB2_9FIRM|nr:ABC transporter ATP-binding protein [Clostridiales bacterium]